jgi:hypothetical protein
MAILSNLCACPVECEAYSSGVMLIPPLAGLEIFLHITPVKIFACLDLEQNISFMNWKLYIRPTPFSGCPGSPIFASIISSFCDQALLHDDSGFILQSNGKTVFLFQPFFKGFQYIIIDVPPKPFFLKALA